MKNICSRFITHILNNSVNYVRKHGYYFRKQFFVIDILLHPQQRKKESYLELFLNKKIGFQTTRMLLERIRIVNFF